MAFVFFYGGQARSAEKSPLEVGAVFPRVLMKPLGGEADRVYLGLEPDRFFTLHDIDADLLVIEIMNTNCVSCQKQAPVYNELFSMIEADAEVNGKIKLFAIAAGNTEPEIAEFKTRFRVLYPIVGDPKYAVWDATGRSRTPVCIVVKREARGAPGVVVAMHLGVQDDARAVFDEVTFWLKSDPPSLGDRRPGLDEKEGGAPVPVVSQQRILELIVAALFRAGIVSAGIKTVQLGKTGALYAGIGNRNGETIRVFAKPILQALPCDACHEVQFIYIFEETGRIIDLVPLQLTKYGNQPFTDREIDKIRARFVGKSIFDGFDFAPGVDAVSAATITSSVVYKAFDDGKRVYEELKSLGMVLVR